MSNENLNDSSIKLVTNALEYYDKNKDKNLEKFKGLKYINFLGDNDKGDLSRKKLLLYDENKVHKKTYKYEFIGVFYKQTETWSWGWAIPHVPKKLTFILRKILNYGFDLEPENLNNQFLRTELITGRFRISNPIQLDLHTAIASYISKIPNTFAYIYDKKRQDYNAEFIELINLENASDDYIIYYLFLFED